MLGGGGYTIRNVARCWTYETAVALDMDDSIANGQIYNSLTINFANYNFQNYHIMTTSNIMVLILNCISLHRI
jgi:hypothetical protein